MIGLPERNQDDIIVFTMFIGYCHDQVRTITDSIVTFQSGSALYLRAKLTRAAHKHRSLSLKPLFYLKLDSTVSVWVDI